MFINQTHLIWYLYTEYSFEWTTAKLLARIRFENGRHLAPTYKPSGEAPSQHKVVQSQEGKIFEVLNLKQIRLNQKQEMHSRKENPWFVSCDFSIKPNMKLGTLEICQRWRHLSSWSSFLRNCRVFHGNNVQHRVTQYLDSQCNALHTLNCCLWALNRRFTRLSRMTKQF